MRTLYRLNTARQVHEFRRWPFTARSISLALSGPDPELQDQISQRINKSLDDCGCGYAGACVLFALLVSTPLAIWAVATDLSDPLPIAVIVLLIGLAAALLGKSIAIYRNWRLILKELDRLELLASTHTSTRMTSLVGS